MDRTSIEHRRWKQRGGVARLRGPILGAILFLTVQSLLASDTPVTAQPLGTDVYLIGAHDVLSISVWNNEKLSHVVSVRPDGRISLPLLMDLQAAGLTPMELRDSIAQKLTAYMESPEVAVIVEEVNSVSFSVMGKVREPGRFPLRGTVTVVEALAQAGGFTDFASPGRIFVLRPTGTTKGTKRIPFDYKKQMRWKKNTSPLVLEPGDVVMVP